MPLLFLQMITEDQQLLLLTTFLFVSAKQRYLKAAIRLGDYKMIFSTKKGLTTQCKLVM